MVEPQRVDDAILGILIDRLWKNGELRTVLASVWTTGYVEGHIEGHNEARFTAIVAEEEQ